MEEIEKKSKYFGLILNILTLPLDSIKGMLFNFVDLIMIQAEPCDLI